MFSFLSKPVDKKLGINCVFKSVLFNMFDLLCPYLMIAISYVIIINLSVSLPPLGSLCGIKAYQISSEYTQCLINLFSDNIFWEPEDSYNDEAKNSHLFSHLSITNCSNKIFYDKINSINELLIKSTLILKQTKKDNTFLDWDRGYQWVSNNQIMLMRLLPFNEEKWRPLTFVTYDIKTKKEQVLATLNTLLATSPSQVCDWNLSPNKQWLLMHLRNATTLFHLNGKGYRDCKDSTRWSTLYWLNDNQHYLEAYGGMNGAFLDYPELSVMNISVQRRGQRLQNSQRNPLINSDETLAFISTQHHLLTFNVPRKAGQYSIEKTAFLLMRDRVHLSRSSRSLILPLPKAGLMTEATFSPDASHIAYVLVVASNKEWKQSRTVTRKVNGYGRFTLWICDWKAGKSYCIASLSAKFTDTLENGFGIDDNHYPCHIHWLPDGKQISFTCEKKLWKLKVVQ